MGSPTSWLRLYTLNYGWRAAAHKCGQEQRGDPAWFVATVRDLMPVAPVLWPSSAINSAWYKAWQENRNRQARERLDAMRMGKPLTFAAQASKTQE